MAQRLERQPACEQAEQVEHPEAQADDAHTSFEDGLELWIIANST